MKLQLNPNPTFKAKVGIHVPGEGEVEVEFEFKYRDRDECKAFLDEHKKSTDVETVMGMVVGWELDDPFNAHNVGLLLKRYPLAQFHIITKYLTELAGAREKN